MILDPVLQQATMYTGAPQYIIDRSELTMPRGIPCDTVPTAQMLGRIVEAQSDISL